MYYFTHRLSDIDVTPSPLVLDIGEFTIMPGGVRAQVHPPLDMMTRYYPWRMLPFAMSAMRTLVDGDADDDVLCQLVNRLKLSVADTDMLSRNIASIAVDADKLLSWSSRIADQCPHQDVAVQLRSISRMTVRERDQYVGSFLS